MRETKRWASPHVFLILSILILLASVLTWLIPAGSYERTFSEATGQTVVIPGSFTRTAPTPVALWQLPRLIFEAASTGQAPQLIAFVLILGGTFEVIMDSGAVAALCGWVVKRTLRRRAWIVPAFVGVFSVFGFTMGLTTASIIFLPLGMSVAKRLGYDRKTGMAMVLLGTNAGFAAGIYNPFSVGIAQAIAELPLYSGAWLRWLLLIVLVAVTSGYILCRSEKQASGSVESISSESVPLTARRGLVLVLLLGALALTVWGIGAQGWKLPEIASVFLALGGLCGIAAGTGGNRTCTLMASGCGRMLPGALTIALAAGLRLVLARGGIMDSIVFGLLRLVEGAPEWGQLLGMFYTNALLDLAITSGSAHAAVAMPLMVPLADTLQLSRQAAVLAFQLGDGLVNLVSPISNTLVSCLALSEISYQEWLKYFLPLVGSYLVIGTVFMLFAGTVGY